jgi:hypothetical protein
MSRPNVGLILIRSGEYLARRIDRGEATKRLKRVLG